MASHQKSKLQLASIFILLSTVLSVSTIQASDQNLCKDDEQIIFNCITTNKLASVCHKFSRTIYRFGKKDRIELVLTANGENTFKYSSAPYSGGGGEQLQVTSGNHLYTLYNFSLTKLDSIGEITKYIEGAGILVQKDKQILADILCTETSGRISSKAGQLFPFTAYNDDISTDKFD